MLLVASVFFTALLTDLFVLFCVLLILGSGKSNILDAISFVLGVQSSSLRGKDAKDLIHRKKDQETKDVKGE